MKTDSTVTKKSFDAVAFMRKRRDEISKDIEGMTPQQEIQYFRTKSEELRNRKK